jgi:HEPN domain-containing protein
MGKSEHESRRWFDQAKDDLAAARTSAAGGHYEWTCFQAQQAAEKALKAFLLAKGKRQFVSHSIKDLLGEAEQIEPGLRELAKARRLDEYYIPTRYPNGLPGTSRPHEFYDEEESSECLQLAELVLNAIDAILGS